jgi:hypothetical protein
MNFTNHLKLIILAIQQNVVIGTRCSFLSFNKILLLFLLIHLVLITKPQTPAAHTKEPESEAVADDPSRYITRFEVFNELQRYHYFVPLKADNIYLNQTTFRGIIKLGEKFTTRLDIPFVYNSFNSIAGLQQFGISDISFRLLGFKMLESPKRALAASIEFSLNTANSPLTGTGKNIAVPLISFTQALKKGVLLAVVFEEPFSFSGDKNRQDFSYSKLQLILLSTWSKKVWTSLAPEWYLDYIQGGLSMNLEGRIAYASRPRVNYYFQAGAGIFGDFIARYTWSAQIGFRYFMFRKGK